MNKIEENGAAKEEISGCHKKYKRDNEQKVAKKVKNKVQEDPKICAKKRLKGEESQGTLGLSKKRKRDGKKGTNRVAMKKR